MNINDVYVCLCLFDKIWIIYLYLILFVLIMRLSVLELASWWMLRFECLCMSPNVTQNRAIGNRECTLCCSPSRFTHLYTVPDCCCISMISMHFIFNGIWCRMYPDEPAQVPEPPPCLDKRVGSGGSGCCVLGDTVHLLENIHWRDWTSQVFFRVINT